jgi:hypothetical protein
MKKIILVSVISILCFLPLVASAQYSLSQTFSTNLYQPYHMDVADDGKIWMSQYGDPNGFGLGRDSRAFLFQDDGTVVLSYSFPTGGAEWAGYPGPSGCAVFGTKGYIAVDTGEAQSETTQLNNCAIWNDDGTRASPAAHTLHYTIPAGDANLRLGDLDFDNLGRLFAAHKVEDGWSVFDKDTGDILSGCPLKGTNWGDGDAGTWYIVRGIAVNHDGTKVYRAYGSGSSGSGIQYWEGSITGGTASYTLIDDSLWSTEMVGNPDTIFLDNGQRIWVPINDKKVRVYDTYDNSFLTEYTFSEIVTGGENSAPRGIALNSDSTALYIHNDWDSQTAHILKYTGTPPPAHPTPTPSPTPSPVYTPDSAVSLDWAIYE